MEIQKFLKFGQETHLQELSRGNLYINHFNYFKKDLLHGIYDKNEGRRNLFHLKNSIIQIKPVTANEWKSLKVKTGKIEGWHDLSNLHIFCLFQLTSEECRMPGNFPFSEKIKAMGDHFMVIANPKAFIERVDKALYGLGYEFKRGLVNYYDESKDQMHLSPFDKTMDYIYQKEFRYLIRGNITEPMRIDVGNLSDISEICKTSDFKGLNFMWTD